MSDLVKQLRDEPGYYKARLLFKAADRIEELEARLKIHDEIIAEKLEQIYRQSKRIEELEEKNAKLTRLNPCLSGYANGYKEMIKAAQETKQ